ncbi:MAG: hypothetical protein WCI09_06980 [Planctomycetota bacterium]
MPCESAERGPEGDRWSMGADLGSSLEERWYGCDTSGVTNDLRHG